MERLGPGQIRLVSFPAAEDPTELLLSRRTLTQLPDYHDDLETWQPPEYLALSYCWGKEREIVRCDGADVEVSSSLAAALPLLRRHFSDQYIWTDSLCIDQHNIGEKAEQVAMMSKVYQCAQRVVVWLGADTEDIYHAFQQEELLIADKGERIRLMKRIATVKWFYRAWTFQEIRLGRNAIVMLGTEIMPWRKFIGLLQALRELEPQLSTVTIRSRPQMYQRFAYQEQDRFFAVLGELNMGTTFDLAGLLFLTWYRECSEKEDKVYSVLGLMANNQSGVETRLDIDYQIMWRKLCIKAARLSMNVSKEFQEPLHPRLKILKISGMVERWKSSITGRWDPNEVSQLLNHPSWSPDWWFPPQKTRSYQSLAYDKRGIFDQLSFCCSDQPPVQDLNDVSPFLSLTGVLLGIVNIDDGPTSIGGYPSVHMPPRCAGHGQQVLSSPEDVNSASPRIRVPKVHMSTFVDAAQRHFDGECSCFPFPKHPSAQLSRSTFDQARQRPLHNRFDSHWHFPILGFPRPADVPEEKFPAQVLAASVESGDWLVLLEGGGMPFILRPTKDRQGHVLRAYQLSRFAHETRPVADDAGCFVLVGEASMCWDKLWPAQWEMYCRAGNFVII